MVYIFTGANQFLQFHSHLFCPDIGEAEEFVDDQQITVYSVVARSRFGVLPRSLLTIVKEKRKNERKGERMRERMRERIRERKKKKEKK